MRNIGDGLLLRLGNQPPAELRSVPEDGAVARPSNALPLEVALDLERNPYGFAKETYGEEEDWEDED